MGLQHDNPNALPQDAPRTQRLTADESRAVIARWQQERVEQTGLTDRPAVPDVAEGLDIPVEEVQRLLAEVRALRLEEGAELAREQELAEIHLAEEERRLAEVRRHRAELRRERAEAGRESVSASGSVRTPRRSTPVGVVFGAIFFVFWLWWVFNIVNVSQHGGSFNNPSTTVGCGTTMPDGTSQRCDASFYRAHPEFKKQ